MSAAVINFGFLILKCVPHDGFCKFRAKGND
jgi:hypothetical protein